MRFGSYIKYSVRFLFLQTLLTLISLIAIPILFNKPFPVNRVLIPFIPIFQVFLISIFGELKKDSYSILLISLLFFNFIFSYNTNESLVWGTSVDISRQGDSQYCKSLEISRPEIQYYLEHRMFC